MFFSKFCFLYSWTLRGCNLGKNQRNGLRLVSFDSGESPLQNSRHNSILSKWDLLPWNATYIMLDANTEFAHSKLNLVFYLAIFSFPWLAIEIKFGWGRGNFLHIFWIWIKFQDLFQTYRGGKLFSENCTDKLLI